MLRVFNADMITRNIKEVKTIGDIKLIQDVAKEEHSEMKFTIKPFIEHCKITDTPVVKWMMLEVIK